MSPLQFSVYWRLSLVFVFTSFLFFLDIFTAAITATCRRDNGTDSDTSRGMLPSAAESNQSQPGEGSEGEADWSTESGNRDSVCGWTDWLSYGQTLFMVGLLLGSLIGGAISDRSGVDSAVRSALAAGLPAVLFQSGDDGWSSSGLAQPHLETPAPVAGSATAGLSAAVPLLDSTWSDLQKSTDVQKEEPPGGHAPSDIIHLRHPTVLLRLFIMSYLSTASALTYFGICMNIGSFGVGVYSAQFFSGLSEAPCLLVPLVRLGRRPISMLALFLSGAACFLSLLLSRYHGEPVLVMSLALLGKLCILAAIFISTLYSIELFPTVVRQRCVSLVNLCFRLGCLVNTLVPPNPNGAISFAAMVVYSSGPIVGCGLCLLLPETSGVPLPDSVEDCDRQPRPRPPSMDGFWRTRKLVSSQTRKTEILPAEKDDTHTPNTHTGLICTHTV
ncbi:solute carrier family 22 member 6 isoform X3 [Seriola aureovittata]|uniref:solute carrier family 22 member 6 isoform X3 n=1 Tax=Seriola aureovittata TaxID=2871759 RepID=UPI0024BDB5D6|nr:solute carrier family 22 member 6 isoform X3 [Seriola aureovittata]